MLGGEGERHCPGGQCGRQVTVRVDLACGPVYWSTTVES